MATSSSSPAETPAAQRRYRVLVIATHPVQYATPIFRRMAQHPQLDFHVVYCTPCGGEGVPDPDFGVTVKWDIPLLDGYEWTELPNRGSGGESFFGMNNPGLWKFIREGRFDAVLCHTGYLRASFWIAYLAAKSSGAAFLFGTDAASVAPRDGRAWKSWLKKIVWPLLYRLADQVLAPSGAGVEFMRSLGIPGERISLTHFVVDNDWWMAQAERVNRRAVRDTWGVRDGDLVVLFCAKLREWKRPLDLLRAFARVRASSAVLVFAGEGPQRNELENEACRLEVSERVRFLGFVNQSALPATYTAADLFVMPSAYDPCPVVVCEAMLCGLPVLLSDEIRGRFDLVKPGVTGDIFRCGDLQALADSLGKLLGDKEALSRMSENARARMSTWSPRENVAGTVEAIQRAVARISAGGKRSGGRGAEIPAADRGLAEKL